MPHIIVPDVSTHPAADSAVTVAVLDQALLAYARTLSRDVVTVLRERWEASGMTLLIVRLAVVQGRHPTGIAVLRDTEVTEEASRDRDAVVCAIADAKKERRILQGDW